MDCISLFCNISPHSNILEWNFPYLHNELVIIAFTIRNKNRKCKCYTFNRRNCLQLYCCLSKT